MHGPIRATDGTTIPWGYSDGGTATGGYIRITWMQYLPPVRPKKRNGIHSGVIPVDVGMRAYMAPEHRRPPRHEARQRMRRPHARGQGVR